MVGAQQLLDVVAHNLANISTNGYKRDGVAFNDSFTRLLTAADGREIGTLSGGTKLQAQYTVHEIGSLTTTGNPLDVAIQAERGMFAVQTGNGTRYTRDGAFTLNSDRELITKSGLPVLDDRETAIVLPAGKIEIGISGAVSVDGELVANIGIFDGAVQKVGNSLYVGVGMQLVDEPHLQSGMIEGSNVNAIEEMIHMIRLNRIYEMAQKAAQGHDEMTQRLIQSLEGR